MNTREIKDVVLNSTLSTLKKIKSGSGPVLKITLLKLNDIQAWFARQRKPFALKTMAGLKQARDMIGNTVRKIVRKMASVKIPRMKMGRVRLSRINALSIIVLAVALLTAGFTGGFLLLLRQTPIDLTKLTMPPKSPTVVYDGTGQVFMTIGATPSNLHFQQIPADLRNAIVATEDHSFWSGSGIDPRGIARALWVDLTTGQASQGASTIEDQLAKIVYLNDNKTLSYKIKELLMGVQIDRHFTKQEILSMYLNKVYLGEGTVGVQQAAMRYFGIDLAKNPGSLTLPEAALLAGLPQAPSAYDPLLHPKAALVRRNEVLQNMVKYGYITNQQAKIAEQAPLGTASHPIQGDPWASHPLFTNFLLDYAGRQGISPNQILQGGLKIYTTIDPSVQRALHTVFWTSQYQADFPGPASGTVVQGAAVFVNPATGGILGAAGSRQQGFAPLGTDRVYSNSSPGSSIKPIMEYAPAIESGNWSPTSILDNQPQNFGGGYQPVNWEGPSGPAKVTLQYGLQWSQNIASVWLLKQIGIQVGTGFAMNDGIALTNQDRQQLGVAIGGMQQGVNPMEMAQAYEGFDNAGVQMKTHLINRITNQHGQIIYQFQPTEKRVMSQRTAQVMTRLMEDVVDYGTGTSASVANWGVAGKTGTVQYGAGLTSSNPNWIRDAWFDGYTPNMVGSIHIGYDVSSPLHHMTMTPLDPSANAAKLFADIVKLAEAGQAPEQFQYGPYPATQALVGAASSGANRTGRVPVHPLHPGHAPRFKHGRPHGRH